MRNILQNIAFFFYLCSVTEGLQCLMDMKSAPDHKDMKSQKCLSTHDILLAHPKGNVTHVTVNNSLNNHDVEHCLAFKHLKKNQMTFTCDIQHVCKNYGKYNVEILATLNGETGWLYCCDKDDCNSKDIAEKLQSKQSSCLRGKVTDLGKPNSTVSVQCYGTSCRSFQKVWSEPISHDCDDDNMCGKYQVPVNTCQKVTTDNVGTLCCCNGSNCTIHPTQVYPKTPLPPMPNLPSKNGLLHSSTHLNWLFVGVLIGAVVVSCLVLVVAVVLIRHCKHQRELSHQRAYSYQQLTADFADDPENGDDKLIIA